MLFPWAHCLAHTGWVTPKSLATSGQPGPAKYLTGVDTELASTALPTCSRDSHAMFQPEMLQATYASPNSLHTHVLVPSRGKVWQQSWRGTRPGEGEQGREPVLGRQ